MKPCKYQAVIIATIVFSIIIVTFFLFWDYMWEGDLLGKWASLITILSVIGIPMAYFSNLTKKDEEKKQKENDERDRASRNLFGELNDTLNALDENQHHDLKKVEIQNNEFYFTNRAFNHDFYDSLIFSGKINFLKPELQQPIQDIFQRIKDHNFYIRRIRDIEDKAKTNEDISLKTLRYYKILSEDEEILLEDIPNMKIKLKEEFAIDDSIFS